MNHQSWRSVTTKKTKYKAPDPLPASCHILRRHYKGCGLEEGWKKNRFLRLCRLWRMRPEELGYACCIPPATLRRWMYKGVFPPYVSLTFAMFEAMYFEVVRGHACDPIVPVHLVAHFLEGKKEEKNDGD